MRKILISCLIAMGMCSVARSQTTDTVNVTAEVITGGVSELMIQPSSIDFGQLSAFPTNHRFVASTSLTATFFAATSPWSIEVTTSNPSNLVGLVSPTFDTIPQFKFNQPNFGEGIPIVDTNWTGVSATWKGIFDIDDPSDPSTLGSSAIQDSSPIVFDLAVDAAAAVKTTYSADVRFDLVVE